ncbi:MAG: RIP metalloprotease RseP, partial [Oxalobacter sp.]|nr:RIP metalloprotease RseP [Oxalobacter sp.]
MIILQTVSAFIIALSLLIMVHELGHYWVARLCNVKVLRFSLGMGKIVFSRRFGRDQTEWALSILPMGGYVKLLDARTEDLSTLTPEERKREFTGKNVWCRIAIVAAGPLANFLLAIILLAGLYMYGVPEPLAKLRAVPENTVAWEAGLRGGERVVGINGVPAASWLDVRWRLLEAMMGDHPVVLEVQSADILSDDKNSSRTVALPMTPHRVGELNADFLDRFGLSLARPPAVVGKVSPGGAAEKAGLRASDHIVRINGELLVDGLDFIHRVREAPGNPLVLSVIRDNRKIELTVVPEGHEEKGAVIGRVQAEIPIVPEMVIVQHGFFSSFGKGAVKAWETTSLTLKM